MLFSIAQAVIAVLLIILILLQERNSGISGILGGGAGSGASYQTRRGLEKIIFYGTIVVAVIFVILALLKLVLK